MSTRPRLAAASLAVVAGGIALLANGYHRVGHPQGDDFALYLRQARSLFDGDVAQVILDNRFTVLFSGGTPFTPNVYPWGFPILLSPFVRLWGLDYDRLKVVVVASLVVWLLLVHGVVRRRIGRMSALVVIAAVGTSPLILRHTDSLLSEFPHAAAVAAIVWWFDRCHARHGWLLDWPRRALIVLGVFGALAYNVRRETIIVVVAIAAVQVVEIVRRGRTSRPSLEAVVAPHVGFVGAAALAQLLLPSTLFPDNGGGREFLGARLGDYTGLLTDHFGLERHPLVGLIVLSIAAVGVAIGVARRPHLDGFVALVALGSLIAISTHFRLVGRYYFQLMPWVAYFMVVAGREGLSAIVRGLGRDSASVQRAVRVVALSPLVFVIALHGIVVPRDVAEVADRTADGFVHIGPANPKVAAVYEAVRAYTHPDDIVTFFRARTMTLLTDRRTIQTSNLDTVIAVSDYFAQQRSSDFYQPALGIGALEALGFVIVWSDETWILWRVP